MRVDRWAPFSEKKEASRQIRSEWLGAEAQVNVPLQTRSGSRLLWRYRWDAPNGILFSFLSGLAMGGCLAIFAATVQRTSSCRVR